MMGYPSALGRMRELTVVAGKSRACAVLIPTLASRRSRSSWKAKRRPGRHRARLALSHQAEHDHCRSANTRASTVRP